MIEQVLANELNAQPKQIQAAIKLLDEGATVPFIARYRKEVTQGLDDAQLRTLETRLTYLRDLEDRRSVIVKSISDQDKLSDELLAKINAADSKTELEDLYLPYKPRRRTKAQIAREAGLEPLALAICDNTSILPEQEALKYLNEEKEVADTKAVLDGARHILIEQLSENAQVLQDVRKHIQVQAHLVSSVIAGMESKGEKFTDYFSYSEKLSNIPSHRALAIFRGRNEGILQVGLDCEPNSEDGVNSSSQIEQIIQHASQIDFSGAQERVSYLQTVVAWAWRVKIKNHLETEFFTTIRERAELEAIDVFAKNLSDLLMAAPAGPKVTMGLDPGLRTGVKTAIVDATGKVLSHTTIFPHQPQNQWDKSIRTLANLCKQFKVEVISIGNGTGSRETDKLVAEVIKNHADLNLQKIVVSEAGASVYSASALASSELSELDVSLRGAVSIARRLQDPLAELVKIEPKAIGVGQYQHDVNQSQLGQSLDKVVEDCVNAVGVDVNTASPALLTHVSGLNKTLAQNIVAFRDTNGAFNNRNQLKSVERLGPKAFEQSAGFLRIMNGDNPIDTSAVHPEAYSVVDAIKEKVGMPVSELIGNKEAIRQANASDFVNDEFGLPTINDIFKELEKPGRDPRGTFKTAKFNDAVNSIGELKVGMVLEGVVSNVANFGAFVDVGVHQDGLVHISAITNRFIKDPREVVKTGDVVKVKVTEVDVARKRISLSMRLDDDAQTPHAGQSRKSGQSAQNTNAKAAKTRPSKRPNNTQSGNSAMGNAFAEAFAKAKK